MFYAIHESLTPCAPAEAEALPREMPFVAVLQPVDMIATGERLGSSSSSGILYASSV